jgi:XisH protein
MPAVDQCHPQVVRTLEKAGWYVERRQVLIQIKKRRGYIDLRASRGENGTQQHILLVEVKCFANSDEQTSDLYMAVGQYLVYRSMLHELHNPTSLYLCVPHSLTRNYSIDLFSG